MEVELDPSLLGARPREDLTLLALCAFGLIGRHRVLVDRRVWDPWAEQLPEDLRDEVFLTWDESERRATAGGPSERITVVPTGPAQFGQVPIRLTPIEALGLLGRPLRVFLENGRNDRAFVLAFAGAATQKALLEAERAGWLVFETAGGINELAVRVREAGSSAPREVFRTIYLCDSDALEPGQPSQTAGTIAQDLVSLGAIYNRPSSHFGKVLTLRAAENYAPPNAVLVWAQDRFGHNAWQLSRDAKLPDERAKLAIDTGVPNIKKRNLLAAIALNELSRPVRGYLDMKEGRSRGRTADSVWNQLDAFQQAALLDGFGKGFSASFYNGQTGVHDQTGEITALLATIMERL